MKAYASLGVLLVVGLLFVIVSVRSLTTWPAFWYDEAVAVEIAHNFADTGVLNVSVAPAQYSPYAMMIGANGYPLTAPLAALFKIFGFSLELARVYMLAWCLALVAALYLFVRRFFGPFEAAAASVLMLSFASFFANGRTVTGEIPGFFFLLIGLWLLLRSNYWYAGLLLGLAAAAKPSLYLWLCVPAALDVFLYAENKIKNIVLVALGYALPVAVWIFLTVPWPVPAGFISQLVTYYKNPFGSSSILGNIISNSVHAPLNSTLVYFGLGIVVVAFAFWFTPKESTLTRRIYLFFAIVSALCLFYFLRSPGWLRYLLPLELCTLSLLPHAITQLSARFNLKIGYPAAAVIFLVLLQGYILFYHSNIGASSLPEQVASYLNENLAGGTVGIINAPTVAALVPAARTYQYISMTGIPNHGVNALSLPHGQLPKFMVVNASYQDLINTYASVLQSQYVRVLPDSGGYLVYEKK